MEKIAKNSIEFIDKTSKAIVDTLNTPRGQELVAGLRKTALEENPDMTVAEWDHIKEGFIAYIFNEFMEKFPDMKLEFAEHIYNDLIAREEE